MAHRDSAISPPLWTEHPSLSFFSARRHGREDSEEGSPSMRPRDSSAVISECPASACRARGRAVRGDPFSDLAAASTFAPRSLDIRPRGPLTARAALVCRRQTPAQRRTLATKCPRARSSFNATNAAGLLRTRSITLAAHSSALCSCSILVLRSAHLRATSQVCASTWSYPTRV